MTDDEIRTMLRDVGVRDATDEQVRAVRTLSEAAVCSPPVAVRLISGADSDANPLARRPGPLRRAWRRFVDAIDREQLERERYLYGSDDVREAFLAGHAAGLRDALLLRP